MNDDAPDDLVSKSLPDLTRWLREHVADVDLKETLGRLEKRYGSLPKGITVSFTGSDNAATLRSRALIVLAYAKARECDKLQAAIKKLRLEDPVKNARDAELFSKWAKAIRTGNWRLLNAARKTSRRQRWGKGGHEVKRNYAWLDARHEVPALRRALGYSDEGMRKAIQEEGIAVTKSKSKRIAPGIISRDSALRLLTRSLKRRKLREDNVPQTIWDFYGQHQKSSSGYRDLRAILMSCGANCREQRATGLSLFESHFGSLPE